MKKPVLVIMAAGMGSRYGGLKQIDPVDERDILSWIFHMYDARRAGFEKVVFIIKRENEQISRGCRQPYSQNIWKYCVCLIRNFLTFPTGLPCRKGG